MDKVTPVFCLDFLSILFHLTDHLFQRDALLNDGVSLQVRGRELPA
jgi:hypothetical protein